MSNDRAQPSLAPTDGVLETIRTLGRLLDDLEADRIRQTNRIGALERSRGEAMPHLYAVIEPIERAEHLAERELVRVWRRHPLAPWAKSVRGVGEKSIARLIAEIGEPSLGSDGHWETHENGAAKVDAESTFATPPDNEDGATAIANPSINTPRSRTWIIDEYWERSVSQLWQYCGVGDPARSKIAKGATQAELMKRGKPRAKKQLYLIATSMLKAGNREVYDAGRERYADRVHVDACAPCHAKKDDPWKPGHQHMAALRLVEKTLLRDLWLEAQRLRGVEE